MEASEAMRDYKEKSVVDEDEHTSRKWVAGKTFDYQSGFWIEDGLSLEKGSKFTEVEAYSKSYFKLLKKHRELARILKLGPQVVVELDGKVYKFVDVKKKK